MTVTNGSLSTIPQHSKTLPCLAESARAARHLVRTALTDWGMDELIDDGALLVTELVANAAMHTRSPTMTVAVKHPFLELVRIEVGDRCPALPLRRTANDDEAGGRGLALVDALSFRWGTEAEPQGKRVWAELKVEGRDG